MAKKQTYYVTIKGKKFDRGLIDLANSSTEGKRDGRISIGDAKKLLNAVKDNNTYTDIEKKTMEYIRENYKFTDKADEWFRTEIRKWAAEKSAHSSGKKNEMEEYTTSDEAIGLVVPHGSDLHERNYSGYIPTPSAGQTKKHSGIPVLILSLIILLGFGIGIFYAFQKNLNQSASSSSPAPQASETKKHKENPKEKKEPEKKESVSSSSSKDGSILDFFSKKYEPVSLSGKDAELAKKIQESAVIFEKNDISVHSSSRKTLDALTFLLKKHSDLKAILIGYASMEGTEQVNLRVSQLRAEMVRDYIVGNGIESSRLILEARGSAQPERKVNSGASSQKNRRVDIQIVK